MLDKCPTQIHKSRDYQNYPIFLFIGRRYLWSNPCTPKKKKKMTHKETRKKSNYAYRANNNLQPRIAPPVVGNIQKILKKLDKLNQESSRSLNKEVQTK